MAEKQFNVDLDETLIKKLRLYVAEHDLGLKEVCGRALSAYMDGQQHFPYREGNRDLHEKLERVLNSGDEGIIGAIVPNVEIFFDRLKPAHRRTGTGGFEPRQIGLKRKGG